MGTLQTIEVANLGMWDSLILMVMALVVFGPRRLPEIGRQVGKLMYEIRKASNDFKFQMEDELRKSEDAERQKKEDERLAALALAAPAQSTLNAQIAGTPTSESLDRTPLPDGQFPIPNPYPEEANYPPAIAAATATQAEEPYPRIQLPSTGQPVEAARPHSVPQDALPSQAPAGPAAAEDRQANHG
ncbi:MAG: twin-arginine translocase TatA/TatE family subunit [Terracidiphilus sp.]|jgi:sec-independent protein translocase protein TatB